MRKIIILSFFLFLSQFNKITAQTDTAREIKAVSNIPGLVADTSSMTDDLVIEDGPDYISNVFKGTRVINSNSTEMIGAKNLDFRICHRFGTLNEGSYTLWGLDQAYQRMSFTYGLTDLINLEVGRSSVNKMYDGSFKMKFMRQAKGDKNRPLNIVYFANMAIQTEKPNTQLKPYYFVHRLFYTHQLLVSKKFGKNFSLQLMPTLVHRNLVDSQEYKNNVFSIGIAGRNKLTRKTALTYEYFYVLPGQIKTTMYNSFSLGFDIETGGHVFQLHLTNSTSLNEKGFIAETNQNWLKGGIHFGFNISRVFYIGRN